MALHLFKKELEITFEKIAQHILSLQAKQYWLLFANY